MNFEELEKLLTTKQVAEMFDVEARIVRRAARKGTIPGAVKVLGKVGFDPDLVVEWTPPEPGERKVAIRREDGRQRYRIYLNAEERSKLTGQGFEIVDPREAAKARRAARKAAKAAAEAEAGPEASPDVSADVPSEDPFADFGA